MNAHLKSRRAKKSTNIQESRRESISLYGDVLQLDTAENELLRSFVWIVCLK